MRLSAVALLAALLPFAPACSGGSTQSPESKAATEAYEAWRATLPEELPYPFACTMELGVVVEDGSDTGMDVDAVLKGTLSYRDPESVRFDGTITGAGATEVDGLSGDFKILLADGRLYVSGTIRQWGTSSNGGTRANPETVEGGFSIGADMIQQFASVATEMSQSMGMGAAAPATGFLARPIGEWMHPVGYGDVAVSGARVLRFSQAGGEARVTVGANMDDMESMLSDVEGEDRADAQRMMDWVEGIEVDLVFDAATGFPRPTTLDLELTEGLMGDESPKMDFQLRFGFDDLDLDPDFAWTPFNAPRAADFMDLDPFVDMMMAGLADAEANGDLNF